MNRSLFLNVHSIKCGVLDDPIVDGYSSNYNFIVLVVIFLLLKKSGFFFHFLFPPVVKTRIRRAPAFASWMRRRVRVKRTLSVGITTRTEARVFHLYTVVAGATGRQHSIKTQVSPLFGHII